MTIPAFALLQRAPRPPYAAVQSFPDLDAWSRAIRGDNDDSPLAVATAHDNDGAELAAVIRDLPETVVARRTIVVLLADQCTGGALGTPAVRARITDLIPHDESALRDLVVAHLHDPDGRGACADSLRLLLGRWGRTADALLRCSIGSRFARGSVKAAVLALGTDRWTLRRRLRAEHAASPGCVLDAALVVVCVLLRMRTGWSSCRVARYLGFADERPLNAVSLRATGLSLAALRRPRENGLGDDPVARLVTLLDRYVASGVTPSGRNLQRIHPSTSGEPLADSRIIC